MKDVEAQPVDAGTAANLGGSDGVQGDAGAEDRHPEVEDDLQPEEKVDLKHQFNYTNPDSQSHANYAGYISPNTGGSAQYVKSLLPQDVGQCNAGVTNSISAETATH